jgi:hypothetical protein
MASERGRGHIALAAAVVALLPITALADPKPDVGRLAPAPIAVEAKPIEAFDRTGTGTSHFGRLEWRGGLALTSSSPYFGGWSGLVMDPDGRRFVAISDSGIWMTGELNTTGGKPQGVSNTRIGPLLAADGLPFTRERDRDSEAVALVNGTVGNGSLLVAFEQNHRILSYDITRDGLSAARGALPMPPEAKHMSSNKGLEAMTVMRGGPFKGATIAFSERLLDRNHNHTGWIWSGASPQRLNLENIGDFELTDLASQEDGTLFVLERRFRWLEGVKMRLRRILPQDLQPGRTIHGEVLVEADLNYEIDNMEGLSLSRGKPGETIITMISDDNFNHLLQRTLLLQFSFSEPQTAKARAEH